MYDVQLTRAAGIALITDLAGDAFTGLRGD